MGMMSETKWVFNYSQTCPCGHLY